MRTINVGTDVFAKIWSLRKPGEETEDAILRRELGCDSAAKSRKSDGGLAANGPKGFRDRQFDVHFEEGFEIFRTYLGTDYKARATGGRWVLANTGHAYVSLNELSRAIGAKTENAWVNWYYSDASGVRRTISDLRDPNRIRRRQRMMSPQQISVQDL